MSFDEPTEPSQEDIRTFWGIVEALAPLTESLHQSIGTIGDCQVVAEMAAAQLARWVEVAEQCHDLNYGQFHIVRLTYERHAAQWVVYREGFAAFHDDDLEPKYFPSATAALNACDTLLEEEARRDEPSNQPIE